MTEQTDAAEVETLARVLFRADRNSSPSGQGFGATYEEDTCQFAYRAQARELLASEWLAADRAAAEARGAERGWDEGAETTADWMSNNPSPSGVPADPPTNPYAAASVARGGAL